MKSKLKSICDLGSSRIINCRERKTLAIKILRLGSLLLLFLVFNQIKINAQCYTSDGPASPRNFTGYGSVPQSDWSSLTWYEYPINLIICDPGGWNIPNIVEDFYKQLDKANEAFSPVKMRFLVLNDIRVQSNSPFTTLDPAYLGCTGSGLHPLRESGVINVYVGQTINNGCASGSCPSIGGLANFPWLKGQRDVIFLQKATMSSNFSLLAHELGHAFGLVHTWNNSGNDGVPDTQNDPNNGTVTSDGCTGSFIFWKDNIMSYNSYGGCNVRGFSNDQLGMMRKVAQTATSSNGKKDEFDFGCSTGNVEIKYKANLASIRRHVVRTSGNCYITMPNETDNTPTLMVYAAALRINKGTITSLNTVETCNGQMENRPSNELEEEEMGLPIQDNNVLVYPNPTQNSVTIQLGGEISFIGQKMIIRDMMSRPIIIQNVDNELNNISLINHPKGMYLLEVEDVLRNKYIRKIIKN